MIDPPHPRCAVPRTHWFRSCSRKMPNPPAPFGVSMMLRRIAKLFLLCVLGLAVAGCGKSGSSGSKSAHVRFMNAVVDAGPLNVTVGTKSVGTGLAFEGLPTYQETDSGTQQYKV